MEGREAEEGMEVEQMVTLKVLIDKERNRVVFAESDHIFVDVLLSFLTLPVGTIIKLLRKEHQSHSQTPAVLGSLTTLYQGLENLDVRNFKTEHHKRILLHLTNPSQAQCRMLKLNIDDTEPVKYYLCEECYSREKALVTTCANEKCRCGRVLSKEMYLAEDFVGFGGQNNQGVFVKESATFIITDDLRVTPSSPTTSLELFSSLTVRDVSVLEERMVNLGALEVLSLLKLSFLSKTPLTDLLLQSSGELLEPALQINSRSIKAKSNQFKKLKLMIRKSTKKVLYAEVDESCVDYLLTLLAIPLGSMVKFLDKTRSLGCISNLYKSVEDLDVNRYMKSEDMKEKLLSPNQLGLQISYKTSVFSGLHMRTISNEACHVKSVDSTSKIFINAELPTLDSIKDFKFIEGPGTFMVTDDLVVIPLSSVSSISFLNQLEVPISDIEVRVVKFGKEEALKLLEASLISKFALTIAFNVGRNLEDWGSVFHH